MTRSQHLSGQQHLSSFLPHAQHSQQQAAPAAHLTLGINGHEENLLGSVESSADVRSGNEPDVSADRTVLHSSMNPGTSNSAPGPEPPQCDWRQCGHSRSDGSQVSSHLPVLSEHVLPVASAAAEIDAEKGGGGDYRTALMHQTARATSRCRLNQRGRHHGQERESGLSVISTGGASEASTSGGLQSEGAFMASRREQRYAATAREDNSDKLNLHSALSAVCCHGADEWIESGSGHHDGGVVGLGGRPQNSVKFDVIQFEDGACDGNEVPTARSSPTAKAAAAAVSK